MRQVSVSVVVVVTVLISCAVGAASHTSPRTTTPGSRDTTNSTSTTHPTPAPSCLQNFTCDAEPPAYFCHFRGSSGGNRNMWFRTNTLPDIRHNKGYYFTAGHNRLDDRGTADLTAPGVCPSPSVRVGFSYQTVLVGTGLHVITRCEPQDETEQQQQQQQQEELDRRSLEYGYYSSRFFRYTDYVLRACPTANTVVTFQAIIPPDSYRKTIFALDNIYISPWNGTVTTTPSSTLSLTPRPTTLPDLSITTPVNASPSLKSPSHFCAILFGAALALRLSIQ